MDGSTSTWSNSTSLTIGNEGSGSLAISAGAVVSVGGSLTLATDAGATGTLNIGTGGVAGVLDIDTAETIGSLTGAGVVNLDADLTVGDATSTTYSGVIQGGSGFTKQGTGTLTLSGTNTYTATTKIYITRNIGGADGIAGREDSTINKDATHRAGAT